MQTFPEHLLCASILSRHWRQNSEADGQKLLYWGVRGHGAGFLPSGQNKGVFLGEGQNLHVCTCFIMAGSAFSPQALVDAGEGDPQLHFHCAQTISPSPRISCPTSRLTRMSPANTSTTQAWYFTEDGATGPTLLVPLQRAGLGPPACPRLSSPHHTFFLRPPPQPCHSKINPQSPRCEPHRLPLHHSAIAGFTDFHKGAWVFGDG